MKVLIDVQDEIYKKIQDSNVDESLMIEPYKWIKNGVSIPKGHGRLVDADEIDNNIYDLTRSMNLNYGQISEVVDTAQTIIETDRSEE